MFPLLLILVAVGSVLFSNVHTQEQILGFVLRFVPVSREFLSANLLTVLRARGAVGAIGIVGLLWSATSAFTVLVRNLNRAWPGARARGALGSRLMALALVGALTAMAVLFLAAKAIAPLALNWSWLARWLPTVQEAIGSASTAAIMVSIFGGMLLLYRLVPGTRVGWTEAAAGAAGSTAAFAMATAVFTRYLNSGFAQYNIIYGSLGTLVALLVWVYLLSLIVLIGAHLCAAVGSVLRADRAAATDAAAREADQGDAEAISETAGEVGGDA